LGCLAHNRNRLAEAESRERDAIAMLRRLGKDKLLLADALHQLGEIVDESGRLNEAEPIISEAVALRRKLLGNDNLPVAASLATLVNILERQGRFTEAEPLCRECLLIREARIPGNWRVFNTRSMLGGCLMGQKRYADAEPLLLSGYEGMRQHEASKVRL